MTAKNPTDNKCPICGAASVDRKEFASGFSERFACGSVNHSDGFEEGSACIAPGAVLETPAASPAGLLGDMTSLALTANIRGMTVEGVHRRVSEICMRHGLRPVIPERNRIKAIEFAQSLMTMTFAIKRPDISEDALDAKLDTLLEDLRIRLNETINEVQETA